MVEPVVALSRAPCLIVLAIREPFVAEIQVWLQPFFVVDAAVSVDQSLRVHLPTNLRINLHFRLYYVAPEA